jgi:mono/diheme cytochrome c family protein
MARISGLVLALAVALAGWFAIPQARSQAYEVTETPDDLPEGKGRDETFYACAACHGTAIIKAQGMSRERWEATIDWMVERHGMPEIDADDRALIVEYLARAFPSRQRGRPNPFLR